MSSDLLEVFVLKLIQVCLESGAGLGRTSPLPAGRGSVSAASSTNPHVFSTALCSSSAPRRACPWGDAPLYHPQAASSPRPCLHSCSSCSLPAPLAVRALAGLCCRICPARRAHTALCWAPGLWQLQPHPAVWEACPNTCQQLCCANSCPRKALQRSPAPLAARADC